MKKVKPIHPKLYIKIINSDNPKIIYKQNRFDEYGSRILEEEFLNEKIKNNNFIKLLYKKNKHQKENLEKFIKIQKKVLEKHEKARNYDVCKIVKSSIELLNDFDKEFNDWFKSVDYNE